MIVLDTNVVSELMRSSREPKVVHWFGKQPGSDVAISTITIAEIEKGICRLPDGKRRNELRSDFERFMLDAFSGRVFPFDEVAARAFGALAGAKVKSGFNTGSLDLMIAAIALTHNAKLATRNTRDFEGCGIELINPWQVTGPS